MRAAFGRPAAGRGPQAAGVLRRPGRGRRATVTASREHPWRNGLRGRLPVASRRRRGLGQGRPGPDGVARARVRLRRGRHRHRRGPAGQPAGRGCSGCARTGRSSTGWASTTTAPPRWRRGLAPRSGRLARAVGVSLGKSKVTPVEAEPIERLPDLAAAAAPLRRLPRGQRQLARTPRACGTSRPGPRCTDAGSPHGGRGRTCWPARTAAGAAAGQDRPGPGRRRRPGEWSTSAVGQAWPASSPRTPPSTGEGCATATPAPIEAGGLSGRRCSPGRSRSCGRLSAQAGDRLAIIGVGGISERRGRAPHGRRRGRPGAALHRLHLPGPGAGPRRSPGRSALRPTAATDPKEPPMSHRRDRPFGRRPAARRRWRDRGPLCAGIDPHPALLRAWGLADDVAGLERFALTAVEALGPTVAVVKPQSAFFERLRPPRDRGAGAGDRRRPRRRRAGAARRQARRHRLDDGRPTPTPTSTRPRRSPPTHHGHRPILGFGSLRPGRRHRAGATDAGVFVLALTSNPEGPEVQHARDAGGGTVAGAVLGRRQPRQRRRRAARLVRGRRRRHDRRGRRDGPTSTSTARCWRPASAPRAAPWPTYAGSSARPGRTCCRRAPARSWPPGPTRPPCGRRPRASPSRSGERTSTRVAQ